MEQMNEMCHQFTCGQTHLWDQLPIADWDEYFIAECSKPQLCPSNYLLLSQTSFLAQAKTTSWTAASKYSSCYSNNCQWLQNFQYNIHDTCPPPIYFISKADVCAVSHSHCITYMHMLACSRYESIYAEVPCFISSIYWVHMNSRQ